MNRRMKTPLLYDGFFLLPSCGRLLVLFYFFKFPKFQALSVHYSGGSSLQEDVAAWLKENGIIE